MKKIKKTDLRLEKEVITALTSNDLGYVRGGVNPPTKDYVCTPLTRTPDCLITGNKCPMEPSVDFVCQPTNQTKILAECKLEISARCNIGQ